jgi:hypothetical protein
MRMDSKPTPEPFRIDDATLYPLDWLRERLRGIVELATLLDRTGLRAKRKFRDAILGSELLDALARAEPYADSGQGPVQVLEIAGRGRRRGREKAAGKPLGNGAVARLTSKPFEP